MSKPLSARFGRVRRLASRVFNDLHPHAGPTSSWCRQSQLPRSLKVLVRRRCQLPRDRLALGGARSASARQDVLPSPSASARSSEDFGGFGRITERLSQRQVLVVRRVVAGQGDRVVEGGDRRRRQLALVVDPPERSCASETSAPPARRSARAATHNRVFRRARRGWLPSDQNFARRANKSLLRRRR